MQDKRRKIGRRGLAKSSWMWGLNRLGMTGTRGVKQKPIAGVTDISVIKSANLNGYMLQNRIKYLHKILPGGWESTVERKATNKIMAQARNKLERKWRQEMGMPRKKRNEPRQDQAFLAQYFLKG